MNYDPLTDPTPIEHFGPAQFGFQRKYARGRIVNIGCHADGAELREKMGAVNVDLSATDPRTGQGLPVDVIADIRKGLPFPPNRFDTAVLGDILEHFQDHDAVLAIQNAAATISPGGWVLISCPEDYRSKEELGGHGEYIDVVYAYHWRPVSHQMIQNWLVQAGLDPIVVEQISYPFCDCGWGVVGLKPYPEGTNEC